VFKLDPFVGVNAKPVPYSRSDYFKIMLVNGNYKMYYADEAVEIQKQALTFSNPQIPYACEHTERIQSGFFLRLHSGFLSSIWNLNRYTVFQPGGTHIFELTDEQVKNVTNIYEHMFKENKF
jgi:hypothetical protein